MEYSSCGKGREVWWRVIDVYIASIYSSLSSNAVHTAVDGKGHSCQGEQQRREEKRKGEEANRKHGEGAR